MDQLIFHGIGDYLIQNDWMALNKKKPGWTGFFACLIHTVTYSLPFLFITSWKAVLVIWATHFILDRWHIVDWFLACRNLVFNIENFGFSKERPLFITIWLYIITDNIFHLICNYLAIKYL